MKLNARILHFAQMVYLWREFPSTLVLGWRYTEPPSPSPFPLPLPNGSPCFKCMPSQDDIATSALHRPIQSVFPPHLLTPYLTLYHANNVMH
jgi:hypothetical protein